MNLLVKFFSTNKTLIHQSSVSVKCRIYVRWFTCNCRSMNKTLALLTSYKVQNKMTGVYNGYLFFLINNKSDFTKRVILTQSWISVQSLIKSHFEWIRNVVIVDCSCVRQWGSVVGQPGSWKGTPGSLYPNILHTFPYYTQIQ